MTELKTDFKFCFSLNNFFCVGWEEVKPGYLGGGGGGGGWGGGGGGGGGSVLPLPPPVDRIGKTNSLPFCHNRLLLHTLQMLVVIWMLLCTKS